MSFVLPNTCAVLYGSYLDMLFALMMIVGCFFDATDRGAEISITNAVSTLF